MFKDSYLDQSGVDYPSDENHDKRFRREIGEHAFELDVLESLHWFETQE